MPVQILDQGHYELFETIHHHRILVLNGTRWFAWIEGQLGELLVRTDSNHVKDHTIQRGRFFLVDFEDDPKFKDMPHLFLQNGNEYQELLLPDGLPTDDDPQKRVVSTHEMIARDELEQYLKHPAPPGPGEDRLRGHMRRPHGGSMANVVHYLKGVELPATRAELVRYAERRGAPQAVLGELEKIGDKRYVSMAEVTRAIGEAHERTGTEREIPIPNFNEFTVEQAAKMLRRLGPEELRRVKAYERAHKNRKTLLAAIDRLLHAEAS